MNLMKNQIVVRFALAVLLVLAMMPCTVLAVPQEIHYQGYLTDAEGSPLNGEVAMTFRIWDAPGAGTQLWSESHAAVTLREGVFNVILGSSVPITSEILDGDRYLGITWSEISNRPSGLDDGDDVGLAAESDPTVLASVKDGVSWGELSGIPVGFADGVDNMGLTVETDPEVGANTTDFVPRWNGSSLVAGPIYANGSGQVGIGTTSPGALLKIQSTSGTHGVMGSTLDGVNDQSGNASGSGVAGIHTGGGNGVYGRSTTGYSGRFDGKTLVNGNFSVWGDNDDSSIIATFRNNSDTKWTAIDIDGHGTQDTILYFSYGDSTKWSIRNDPGADNHLQIRDENDHTTMEMGRFQTDFGTQFSTDVFPSSDDEFFLGDPMSRWNTVFSVNGVSNTSDVRLKENVNGLEYRLDSIMKLRPVSFQWKDDGQKDRKLGLIAQDVNLEVPEVVDIPESEEGTWGINYGSLVPVLIKAIQDQQEQIEVLKARVQALEQTAGVDYVNQNRL